MAVLFDYFTADSDERAATAIDRVGGPGSDRLGVPEPATEPQQRRGLFRRKPDPAPVPAPEVPSEPLEPFDTVNGFVDQSCRWAPSRNS